MLQKGSLLLLLTSVGLLAPASSASVIYSIAPITTTVNPGDTGDAFEVLLTNTGPSSISIAGFSFGIASTLGLTFTSANTSTTSAPYIFTGDSFDTDFSFPLNTTSGTSLMASDLTSDGANITVSGSQTLALGRVHFNVSPIAPPGMFTIAFTDNPGDNSLSDSAGNGIAIDTLQSEQLPIGGTATTPEPGSLLLVSGGLLALWWRKSSLRARL